MNTISSMNKSHAEIAQYIKKLLGTPTFEAPGALIYSGDCLELMKKLPDALVNLTVTSPPYNIGKEYEDILSIDKYLEWCEQWISSIHRLTNQNGAFWLNLGYLEVPNKGSAVPIPYLLWDKTPFHFIQEVVWNYGAGVACKKMFSPRNEKFLWYVKNSSDYIFNLDEIRDPNVKYPNQKKNGKLKCNPLGKNPTDVWQFPKVTSGKFRSSKERTEHPAQFPSSIIDRIIKGHSNKYNLVLDPFLGSGTTAEVALKNDRFALGFEINPNYIDIIAARIENYLSDKAITESQNLLAI